MRLLELEKAMASISAVESVVSKDGKGGKGIDGKIVETCTEGGASGRLCLKLETATAGRPGDHPSSSKSRPGLGKPMKNEESPAGLVAIAGAVAAVWVFALIMEKRKGPF